MKPGAFLRRLLGRLEAASEPPREGLPKAARFDPEWYLLAYPDARDAVAAGRDADAETHYRRAGAAEGRDPNARFSERWYLEANPDVAAAVAAGELASGFEHFVLFGARAGRRPNDLVVDEDFYRERYPDVAADLDAGRFASAYDHYLEVGAAEGRDPHAAFSESFYRERYPDVAGRVASGRDLSGYQHFVTRGLEEGRQPHPLYDESHYRHLHPDVDAQIRRGALRHGYLHLIGLGLQEGRRWKTKGEAARLREAATRLARVRLDELLASGRLLVFAAPELPRVSVLLVLYNRAELTLACLESLARIEGPGFELIVVDNRSSDRTPELLERLRGAVVLANDDNAGFLRAVNQAAAEARGELLLLLNNDAELLPSSLEAAVERLESEPGAGAVGGRVVGIDGRLEEAGSIVWRDATTGGYGRGADPASGAYLFPREVDYCSGVFLLTRRRDFERLGGFDPRYAPAYYEESDYCFRLRAAGLKTFYEPRSVVLHHGSASLPDETRVSKLLADHRSIFAERHREALAQACPAAPGNLFAASDRRRFRGRVLVLDDHVPLESLGGGSPRAQEILHTLCGLGYFVTFFATNPTRLDVAAALDELPEPNLELIHHLGRPKLADFWRARRGAYEAMIVSRRHNFQCLLDDGFDPRAEGVRLIYDAESVAARRREQQVALLGAGAPAESAVGLEEELALARRANEVWAVSADEARLLGSSGRPVAVVAHGERATPGRRAFAARRGILFVGRLEEAWNPNVDGLAWYLEEVHPRLVERLGDGARISVVGRVGDVELPEPEGARFLGRVDDLAPLYDRHRVFVAPTRFAAGIPKKVTSAAAHGVPVVATSLLARQLGWRDGVEIADGGDNDPERFAERLVELYGDAGLWRTLRENALERVRREHGREALERAIVRALGIDPEAG